MWPFSRKMEAPSPQRLRAYGPETEAILSRDGYHLDLEWWVRGKRLKARVYEPQMMPISDALADVLALALEQRPRLMTEGQP